MNKRISWVDHQGHRFLLADFSGIQDEAEYLGIFDALQQEIFKLPKDQLAPLIVDIANSKMTPAISTRGRKLVDDVRAAGYPNSPAAIIGGTKMQRTVVGAIGLFRKDVLLADTREEAIMQLEKYLSTH